MFEYATRERARKTYLALINEYESAKRGIYDVTRGANTDDVDCIEQDVIDSFKNDLREIASKRRLIEIIFDISEDTIIYLDENVDLMSWNQLYDYVAKMFEISDDD